MDIALLCFTALVIAYCDRANMSVAAPSMLKEYGWDMAQMGWVFTGFFIGYTGLRTGRKIDGPVWPQADIHRKHGIVELD